MALESYQVEKNKQAAALQNSENRVSLRNQVCLFSFIYGIDFIMKAGPAWMANGLSNAKGVPEMINECACYWNSPIWISEGIIFAFLKGSKNTGFK